jgi:hypothetical protein
MLSEGNLNLLLKSALQQTAINVRKVTKWFAHWTGKHNPLTTRDRFGFHRVHGPQSFELLKLDYFLWRKNKWCRRLTLAAPWWWGGESWWRREHWNAQLCATFHTPIKCKSMAASCIKYFIPEAYLFYLAMLYQLYSLYMSGNSLWSSTKLFP